MEEIGNLCRNQGKKIIYCLRGECRDISTSIDLRVPNFENNKLEADNAIFFIYSQIRSSGETSPVVIDAEDTDVLVTSAYVSLFISPYRVCLFRFVCFCLVVCLFLFVPVC